MWFLKQKINREGELSTDYETKLRKENKMYFNFDKDFLWT
jgi:hypothetical protein